MALTREQLARLGIELPQDEIGMGPEPFGDAAGMSLYDFAGQPDEEPVYPDYVMPQLLEPDPYTFRDRLALALQAVPQYSERPGESGGSAFARGLIGGAAQGFSRGTLAARSQKDIAREKENAERARAAERNYQRGVENYKYRVGRADRKAETADARRWQVATEERAAGRAAEGDPMVVLNDPEVAKYMGQPLGARVKQSAYLAAQGGVRSSRAADRAASAAAMAAARASGMSPQQIQAIGTLTDNVRTDPDVKDFVTVRDNFERMREMATANSGAGDLSIIFAYMKVLDPTSVVREAEYNNAAAAIGKIPQLANIPRRWVSGKLLTPEGRRGFIAAANRLYKTKETQYRRAIEMYGKQADTYGIPRDLVMRDFAAAPVEKTPPPGLAPPGPDGVVRRTGGR